jgi:hypothetical protein
MFVWNGCSRVVSCGVGKQVRLSLASTTAMATRYILGNDLANPGHGRYSRSLSPYISRISASNKSQSRKQSERASTSSLAHPAGEVICVLRRLSSTCSVQVPSKLVAYWTLSGSPRGKCRSCDSNKSSDWVRNHSNSAAPPQNFAGSVIRNMAAGAAGIGG